MIRIVGPIFPTASPDEAGWEEVSADEWNAAMALGAPAAVDTTASPGDAR